MIKVGLTGGIGSGKSTVAAIFETLGIPVSYADDEAKRLMNEDPGLRAAISREFGAEAYAGGTLNRKYLAGLVFNDPIKLETLNNLVHPVTIREGSQWMREQAALGHPYAIREAALIFEARGAGNLDFVIGVYAPLALRIHRTMQRDHISREAVQQRMRNQIDEEIKMKLCDAVIRNDEREAVIPQVLALHEKLTSQSRGSGSII
ncbi:MAG TPA: dephospho-CoA kinase [Puia sp.]|uniref:dephospho-CoA kinase n=1 Tax=Puia sp. TaxID=2045100 RepID=UPI002B6251C2|nr:dephospho-CoA kinase [Puia sp.]HVU96712.1 dephospho-CoA kinase [Puia sp.]